MKTTRILFIMAIALSVAFQAEAKKVKLQYQFKAGDQFKYELNLSQDISQEVNGQATNSTVANSHTYAFKVIEVDAAGNFIMNGSLVAVTMSTTSMMGDMKYNSATDTVVPEFAKTLVVPLNETYSFILSPLGKISDVKAPDGIVEKMNKIVEAMGAAAAQMGAAAASGTVTAEGFQKTIGGLLMPFPEGGAEMKKPWEETVKINQMIAFIVKAKSELMSATKEANEIKVTAQISQDPDFPPMEMQGATITYELLGSKDGTLMLDPVTGLINSGESVTSISGAISIDSPQLPSPMSIPMTIRSTEKIVKK